MFQLPATITLSIAATRMYRSLTGFISGSTGMYDPSLLSSFSIAHCRRRPYSSSLESPPIRDNRASNAKPNSPVPMSHSRNEVAANTAYEQFPISYESLHSMDGLGQLVSVTPHGLGPETDLESPGSWRPGNGGGMCG